MEVDSNTTFAYNSTDVLNSTEATTTITPGSDWSDVKDGFYKAGYVILPVVLLFGVTGNTLTIIAMMSKSFKNVVSRYILIALAISDTVLLMSQPFNKLFVQKMFGYDPRASSDIGCKAFFHIFKTGKMTSSWLVLLCFERYIAVVFPLRARSILTKRNILILIAIDYFFMVTFNGVWTFSSELVNGVCKPDVTHPDTKDLYRDFLIAGSSFYSLIPMVLLAIFTPQIVYTLIQQRRSRNRMSSQVNDNRQAQTTRISLMLIGVMVAYIAFILPITVVHNLAFWKNVSVFDTNTVDFFILREVAQILEQLNYATNFCLYVLFSRQFRLRVAAILHLDKCSRKVPTSLRRNAIQSSNTNSSASTKQTDANTSSQQDGEEKPSSSHHSEHKYEVDKQDASQCEQIDAVNVPEVEIVKE